ncbi:MAG: ATPase, T2SS/T4P/T4SS family [Planctomycetota bacterium]|nr:ATPase, T2SS/T4P/T4SS family [Planctomycetota bacterium]
MSGRNEKSAPRFGATARCALALAVGVALAAMALGSPASAQETASHEVGIEPPQPAFLGLRAVGIPQILLLAIFSAVVFYVVNWTFLDVRLVGTNEPLWSAVVLAGGLAGLAAAVLVPLFFIGLPLGLILFAGAAITYVMHRNNLVIPNLRVLTKAHLARLRARLTGKPTESEERGPVVGVGRDIIFMGMDDMPIRLPAANEAQRQGAHEVERIFFDAIVRHATVVGVLMRGHKAQVRLRVAGQVISGGDPEGPVAEQIPAALKRLAGLNPEETRKPQEGRTRAVVGGQTFELRVKTQGSVHGEQIAVRVIDLAGSRMALGDLGLSEEQVQALSEALAKRPGIILVSAPKNSGLTTTLHACLRHFDRYINTVVAFEPHIDLEVENVQHVALSQEDGASAAAAVRGQLRLAPDVVAVDSLSSPEVAAALAEASRQQTVLVCLRASDAGQALSRLLALVPSPEALAAGLSLVVNQRLVRDLCPVCKEAYRPNPEFLRKANLASQRVDVLYRPPKSIAVEKGKPVICPRCNNVRYAGRTGLFELMAIDDEARAMIGRGANVADVRTHTRKSGMRNLQEEGLALVVAGRTSIEEVLRAVKQTT